MAAPVLEVRDLKTHFFTRAGVLPAVDGVSLSVGRGEVMGLVGESGSGKSVTGFSIIGLVDAPGRIVGGRSCSRAADLIDLDAKAQRAICAGRRIAMIFQDPMMTLNPVLRIDDADDRGDAGARGRVARRKRGRGRATRWDASASPRPTSGSTPIRTSSPAACASASPSPSRSCTRPTCIIADEPTTALDVTIQAQILARGAEARARDGHGADLDHATISPSSPASPTGSR